MTPIPSTPSLAQDLIRIHKVVSRGLHTGLIKGKDYLDHSFPQTELITGYSRYIHCLIEILSAHHKSEDLIVFPVFMQYLPSAPYAQLSADHHAIETLLTGMPQAIIELSGGTPEVGLEIIDATLDKLIAIWEPHILLEERYFSKEAINAAINPQEQRRIGEAAVRHSQEHSGPPSWAVPFILYNLEPDERSLMAANFPPTITDELVSIVWKDEWAPMKPFLLD